MLGCGMAGVVAARELRRLLPQERIAVIDRAARATYSPSLAALAVGEVRARSIVRPRARLARHGIEFINAEVHHIDIDRAQVRADSRELRYDYLIVAMGAQPALDQVAGLTESAQGFFSFEAAERLAASLRYFAGGRVLITAPSGPAKWQPAPYELAMLLEHSFHERKMRQKVEITICTPEAGPLAALGQDVSEMIAGQLAHKGIDVRNGAPLHSVEAGRHLARFRDGSEAQFDLLIAIPPQVAPPPVVEAGLANPSGWVSVDRATMQTAIDNVFAVGDVAAMTADREPLMQSAELSKQQALTAVREIASRILGEGAPKALSGKARWFIEVGAGAAMMVSGDFLGEPSHLKAAEPSIIWHWAKSLAEKKWLLGWI